MSDSLEHLPPPTDDGRALDVLGVLVARTAATVILLSTALAGLQQLRDGAATPRGGVLSTTMAPGAMLQLAALAVVVLVAVHGWSRLARRLTLVALALPLLSVAANLAFDTATVGSGGFPPSWTWVWLPVLQTAVSHFLLGLALFATPWRGRIVAGLRATALLLAVLAPAASLSTYAYTAGGYSLVPGLLPPTRLAALLTFVMAFGVAAVAPHRWPVRALVHGADDVGLVRRLLPFIVLMPVISPMFMATARLAGLGSELTIVVGTLGPSLVLVGLLGVTLREHRALTAELHARERQLKAILDGLPQAVHLHAGDGRLLHLNPEGRRIADRLRPEPDGTIDDRYDDLLQRKDLTAEDGGPVSVDELPSVRARRDGKTHGATLGFPTADGVLAWYDVRAAAVPLNDDTTGTVVTYADVTELHEAQHHLALAERSLRLAFDHAPIGVAVVTPGGDVLHHNAALAELLVHSDDGMQLSDFWSSMHPDEREEDAELRTACLIGARDRYLVDRRFRQGSEFWIWTQLSVALIRDEGGSPLHFIAQLTDLRERRALEETLRVAAAQDPLTGLINRRALVDRLEAANRARARDGVDIGLLYLDLDDFKSVNDDYGHEVGDRVLVEVARRLTSATREVDTVCRIGGDEFVVLCTPVDGSTGLQELSTRLEQMSPISVPVGDGSVVVGASLGAALVQQGDDLEAALRRADAAMYRAKHGWSETADRAASTSSSRPGPPVHHRPG